MKWFRRILAIILCVTACVLILLFCLQAGTCLIGGSFIYPFGYMANTNKFKEFQQ